MRARSWIFRYTSVVHRKPRTMGLGSIHDTTLKTARDAARAANALNKRGIDPIDTRDAEVAALVAAAQRRRTFAEVAADFLREQQDGWSPKHYRQTKNILEVHCAPLGKMLVSDISSDDVYAALEPLWRTRTVTAERTRAKIQEVLDVAKARRLRTGDNPAEWRGNLKGRLVKPSSIKTEHSYPSLPHVRIAEFVADLRGRVGTAARAVEFLILTAVRLGDVLGGGYDKRPQMRWTDVDLDQALWIVPATKKIAKFHVPLSLAAVDLLRELPCESDVVFDVSDTWLRKLLKKMNADRAAQGLPTYVDPAQGDRPITMHGFRSSFRCWAADNSLNDDAAEAALAHKRGTKTEQAYNRTTVFDTRRRIMAQWAQYCALPSDSAVVIPFKKEGGTDAALR